MSILGNRVIRKEDPHLLTGGGGYVDNIKLASSRYVTFVRSTVPHGHIVSIDVSGAEATPGVIAVYTADDLDFGPIPAPNFFPNIDQRFYRWPLAKHTVRFVGEPVVAILAETKYAGADAAEQVVIDYDPLPAITTITESKATSCSSPISAPMSVPNSCCPMSPICSRAPTSWSSSPW